jgi:hypothetical protein
MSNDAILVATGIGFSALVIWLTIRIINHRERWAKWAAVVLVITPFVYAASLGPACWIISHNGDEMWSSVPAVYRPVGTVIYHLPYSLQGPIDDFIRLGMKDETGIMIPCDPGGMMGILKAEY